MEGKEILAVVDSVSSEKGLEKDVIFVAMELAIASASQRHFHEDAQLIVEVDRGSGEFITKRQWEVLDENDEEFHRESYISPSESSMEIGELYFEQVDNVEFGRIETQAARQVMLQKVREAEKELIVSKFRSSDNNLVSGFVKRVTRDNIIVDLGQDAEAILPRDQILPGEIFKINDRVRAVLQIKEIEGRGLQLMLSRICSEMVTELFRIEVPEVNEDVIEIRGVARDPGSRSKIAVKTNDGRIDPVGACVGMRGSRVQAVVSELQGEKIEIIPWTDDPVTFVINALAPAVPSKVVMDEDANRMEVVIPDDQLSLAIGRRGQNVRLASQLTGWFVDILTEAEESEKRQEEFTERSKIFIEALDIDDVIAHLMVSEGFITISDIAEASLEELMSIEGFDEDLSSELSARAQNFVKIENQRIDSALKKLKVKNDLYEFSELSKSDILTLAENNIKTLDELAELDSGELFGILGNKVFINEDDAGSVIMKARQHWFTEDKVEE